ncbi:MAG: transposase [Deltaproteobacteria bacterium]|nr:transposase [Deltaproteobacteria bacterium]
MLSFFGSALNLNLHFHALVLDGVYVEDRATGRVRWRRSRRWTTADVEGLVVRIADRAEAWLARQGFGRAGDGGRGRGEEGALSVIQSASVADRSAVGGGRRAKRVQVLGGVRSSSRRCARAAMGTRCMRGSSSPRANQVHYHGVLASRSRLRGRVRPKPPKARKRPARVGTRLSWRPQGRSRWRSWSALLWRVFGVNGFACPKCGEGMVLVRWCCLRRRFVCWGLWVGQRGVRRRGWDGAGCLRRGSRRLGSALFQARRLSSSPTGAYAST